MPPASEDGKVDPPEDADRARPHSGSRLAGVQGLRGIAASSILVYHVWLYSAPSGQRVQLGPISRFVFPYLPVGVTLFFSLSAFLLYRPIVDSIIGERSLPSIRAYLRNRALRILPVYWVILLVLGIGLGAGVIRLSSTEVGLGSLASHPSLLVRNLALVQNFFPTSLITGIPPAWSLAVEVAFYLALPLLGSLAVVAAGRSSTARRRTLAALVPPVLLLLVGLSGKAAAMWLVPPGRGPAPGWSSDWHSVLVRSFWGQADLFAFGMTLAVVWVIVETGRMRLPEWWRKVAFGLMIAIGLSTTRFGRDEVLGASLWATDLAVGCTLLLALVVLPPSSGGRRAVLTRVLESRVLTAAGLVSYSLFLWHEPLVRWLTSRGITLDGRRGFVVNLVIVAAVSGALAALSYRFVERPALRHKAVTTREAPRSRTGRAGEEPLRGRAEVP
jgi:peptidoglycan/LPS O-acetylase OafA/YrhL